MSTEFKDHQSLSNQDRKPLGGMYVPSPQYMDKKSKRVMTPGYLTMALVLVFVGLLFYAYPREGGQYDTAQVPIIRADISPYKERPVDPQGMDIPYMESKVFDTLVQNTKQADAVENLLAPVEQPMARENIDTETANIAEVVTEKVAEVKPKTATIIEAVKVAEKPKLNTTPLLKPINKPVVKPASKPKTTVKTVQQTAVATGKSYVQLGAFGSEKAAKSAWGKFKTQYGSILSGFSFRTEQVKLASGKTLYRLQAGPVSRGLAKSACAKINAKKKGSCLVK